MLRIGKQRDGSKVGVFFYCQEHGNEIATSGVCLETAERLVRNYGTDPQTTALVDNLDIFIIPQINGDGATHSLYDSNRRKNMSNYCDDTTQFPSNDDRPGRPQQLGRRHEPQLPDRFDLRRLPGRESSRAALSGNFAGLFELSEPEVRNETWVQTTFRNIKFTNNIHSSGGYFMWPPGAYTPARVPLPYPPYGTLNFFDQTGKPGARRDQVPPRHRDPAAADRPGDRRALLGRRQLRGRGVLQPTGSSATTSRSATTTTTNPATGAECDLQRRASSRRSATRPTTASTTRASTRRWSSPAATTAC